MNRFLETVRHLSARQIATRAVRMAERQWWRVANAKAPVVAAAPPIAPHQPLWRDLAPSDRGREIAQGRFTFLRETRVRPKWDAPDVPQLWRYHLHQFDYARELEPHVFRELAKSWIAANRRLGGDGWHPYTVSLRIVNWCEALLAFGDDEEIRASIYAQADFLARHLERDVRGNHLLENARALVRAGVFFDHAAWRDLGIRILREEVPEQVLADGGHFERTPGYHVRMMNVLEDVATYVHEPWLTTAVANMRAFLAAITPPDGRLPLIKDTTLDPGTAGSPPVGRVRRPESPSLQLAQSGFFVTRNDERGDFLIADFGRVCPDYLPAHAHADMFSYELTIGRKPIIVDSGVFEYAEGEWRNWFRSTAAHNTVEIDGRDQSEMWGSFRVGRRARPRDVVWTDTPQLTAIAGEHDRYAPVIHHRTIITLHRERIWVIVDRIEGPPAHVARSFIHLHPDATPPNIAPFGAMLSEGEGWYSERFGEKRRNRVLVLETKSPALFGYVISADEPVTVHLSGSTLAISFASVSLALSLEDKKAPRAVARGALEMQ
ncbi:MAG TPA: alginate lyase family protein [Thermoanaerobaculia bacterium]|nr:alginate lyase family protein [Thermoanaerobaculia bacterium]